MFLHSKLHRKKSKSSCCHKIKIKNENKHNKQKKKVMINLQI